MCIFLCVYIYIYMHAYPLQDPHLSRFLSARISPPELFGAEESGFSPRSKFLLKDVNVNAFAARVGLEHFSSQVSLQKTVRSQCGGLCFSAFDQTNCKFN